MSVSRRGFMTRSGLLALAGLGGPAILPAAGAPLRRGERPRRIIHLVADGMSAGTLSCSDYLSHQTRGRGLTWMTLQQRPDVVSSLMNMRSLNSIVTDSSAASSSWGSGSRIVNGHVNVLPDGRVLRTLYELLSDAGWRCGLVTTTEITHATPAGFAANGLKREAAEQVAEQYLERKVDVLLGGGHKFFDPAKRKDKRDLAADYRTMGYAVVRTARELEAAPIAQRLLGVFASGHLPHTIDQMEDPKLKRDVPTLAMMAEAALKRLGRQERFVLQVEGGRVDHGSHACDAAAAFRDMIAFDEALDVCVAYQKRHPETLLVMTTDHGTGNPGLSGAGTAYGDSPKLFANLRSVRRSFEGMDPLLSKAKSPEEIRAIIQDATGYKAPDNKLAMLAAFLAKKGQSIYDLANSPEYQLGQLMANHVGVGWVSGAHTSDYVPVLALGPGAERFAGFLANTDVFHHYLGLAKVDYRNPEVPLLAECGPSAGEAEIVCA